MEPSKVQQRYAQLKKADPTIAEHVQPVLVEVNNNIQVRDAPPSG